MNFFPEPYSRLSISGVSIFCHDKQTLNETPMTPKVSIWDKYLFCLWKSIFDNVYFFGGINSTKDLPISHPRREILNGSVTRYLASPLRCFLRILMRRMEEDCEVKKPFCNSWFQLTHGAFGVGICLRDRPPTLAIHNGIRQNAVVARLRAAHFLSV